MLRKLLFMLIALTLCLAYAPHGEIRADGEDGTTFKIAATLPDLGELVKAVAGERAEVTVFCPGPEDSHRIEARPGYIRALASSDALVLNGMELEDGWLPVLIEQCRNRWVQPGAQGYIDASAAITPLDVPSGPVDRGMGDVHASGNPHYLTDPLNGLRVARLLRDRFSRLWPAHKEEFEKNFDAFRARIGERLVGKELAEKYDFTLLARLFELNRLDRFLEQQGESDKLGGWLAEMRPHHGVKAVSDHQVWSYFARRFGVDVVAQLEPLPGSPPTSRHLRGVIEQIQAQNVKLVLSVPYFNRKHAEFVVERTAAKHVRMSHQTGAIGRGDTDYLSMIDFNVRAIVNALKD